MSNKVQVVTHQKATQVFDSIMRYQDPKFNKLHFYHREISTKTKGVRESRLQLEEVDAQTAKMWYENIKHFLVGVPHKFSHFHLNRAKGFTMWYNSHYYYVRILYYSDHKCWEQVG